MRLRYRKPFRFMPMAKFMNYNGKRYDLYNDGLKCIIDGENLPHFNHIEMSGEEASSIISYKIKKDRTLSLYRLAVFPQLRVNPNNTHGSLTCKAAGLEIKAKEIVLSVEFDGILRFVLQGEGYILKREISTARNTKNIIERLVFEAQKDCVVQLSLPYYHKIIKAKYTFENKDIDLFLQAFIEGTEIDKSYDLMLKKGETKEVISSFGAQKLSRHEMREQISNRTKLIDEVKSITQIITPDEYINQMTKFCKLRVCESIYNTKNGLMHSPGGGGYYGAMWTNDECEYANPLFAYLGFERGEEQSLNCFKLYSRFCSNTTAVYSSIIACGDDVWHGAGDRGDNAMFLYGLARYLLSTGDRQGAMEFMPYVRKAKDYLLSKMNDDGVIESDSDELENRFESGKANLSTQIISYDAFVSLSFLFEEIDERIQSQECMLIAEKIKNAVNKKFASLVEGFDTYKYCDEEKNLRSWICLPLTVGINDKKDGTISALLSSKLRCGQGILTRSGEKTYWDRSTLYAMRGMFFAGEIEKAYDFLKDYTKLRLTGEHVPYPVEAFPEGNASQLSAESALYLRIITEGILGYRPTGFDSFEIKPELPKEWQYFKINKIKLCGKFTDIDIESKDDEYVIKIDKKTYKISKGQTLKITK